MRVLLHAACRVRCAGRCAARRRVTRKPHPSSSPQIGLIFNIFEKLGTPTCDVWPELPGLQHFSEVFPKFKPKSMAEVREKKRFQKARLRSANSPYM
jgi:hypothetical protein